MNVPSVLILIVLLIGLAASRSLLTYLVFTLPMFSAMAVFPPSLLGGTSLTPGAIAVFFFIVCALARWSLFKETLAALSSWNRLGWLGLFFVVAALGAVILPEIFEGDIHAYGMRTASMTSIAPTAANFTQAGYLFLSVLLAGVVSARVKNEPFYFDLILKAMLAGGVVVIATGLVDIIADITGHADDMLRLFHTAEYSSTGGAILGARRILGLTPEPSAFGALATEFCALLLFLRPFYPRRLWRWKVPVVGWTCGLLAFLSTSSTAYVSMFVFLGLYAFYNSYAMSESGTLLRKPATKRITGGIILLGAILLAVIVDGDFIDYCLKMVDVLVFHKQETSSYVERSSWTEAGLNAFFESYGLGVGVGSVRTSNFFVNILASTGLPGFLLFFLFLVTIYTRHASRRDSRQAGVIKAAKFALIPMFAGMFLAGTTPDFGVFPGVLFGIIAGMAGAVKKDPVNFQGVERIDKLRLARISESPE